MIARGGGLFALGLVSVAVATWSPPADACSYAQPGWHTLTVSEQVPTDGALVIGGWCPYECTGESLNVVVRNAGGEEVAGELEQVKINTRDYALIFRPAAPFPVGEYEFDLLRNSDAANRPSELGTPFEVVAPVAVAFGDVKAGFSPAVSEAGNNQVCCPGGPLTSCSTNYCFATQIRRFLLVEFDLTEALPPAARHQYVHRVVPDEADSTASEWNFETTDITGFNSKHDEYCYTVEFKHLVSGVVERSEKVCETHAVAEEFGVFPRAPADLDWDIGRCEQPPEGHETTWCAARADVCTRTQLSSCDNLEQYCAATPPIGTAGAPGTDATPGGAASPSKDGGCSINTADSATRSGVATALVSLALAFFLRRMKRS